jgi:putative spermidine/putrescine transport system permease protein
MGERPISRSLKIIAAIGFVFLLAPVIIVVPLSLSGEVYMAFPPNSWSFRWYAELAHLGKMIDAFALSLKLSVLVTIVDLAVALPAAYALVRIKPRGTTLLKGIFTAPLLLPTIVLGLAMLIVFARFGLLATFQGLLLAHVVVTLPYALGVLSTALESLPKDCDEAAATLGAHPFTVFRRITLPMMNSGVVAASALVFLVSFDEPVLSLFISGPRLTTLPVAMYHYVEDRADPLVAAASVVLVVLTLIVVLVVERTAGLTKTFVK